MIKHIDITAAQKDYAIEETLSKYIHKKIGKLDRHLKRRDREAVRADVKLSESISKKSGKKCTCEVILHIPGARLTATESTINMFAAVDIVETKLQNQLNKHKQTHGGPQMRHRLVARIRRFKRDGGRQ